MTDKTKDSTAQARRVAIRIVDRLFTNGAGERAQRLTLTVDRPRYRDLGGWGELAAIDQVQQVLDSVCSEPRSEQEAELLAVVRDFVSLYAGTHDQLGTSVKEKLARAEQVLARAEGRS